MNITYKTTCCRKSFILGVISSRASVTDGVIHLNVENDIYGEFLSKYINEFFGRTPEISKPKTGGRCRTVSFFSKTGLRYLESLDSDGNLLAPKCEGCEAAFLAGFFFAAGRVSDPEKQYLLEFSPVRRLDKFCEMLSDIGIYFRVTVRRSQTVLYVKQSTMIEDFFAHIGVNDAMFAFMNAKIKGEFRNNANRIANCETNNIDKAVSASHRQISVITALRDANLLSSLPDELEKTAKLRLEHPTLSLSQLAQIAVPTITKSGLSHRLSKIIELAEQLHPSLKTK
jgi:DNA-binding protein WhiA